MPFIGAKENWIRVGWYDRVLTYVSMDTRMGKISIDINVSVNCTISQVEDCYT